MRSLTFWENIVLGKEFLLDYKKIYDFPFQSEEKIKSYQFQKIKKLLSIAYYHTEFYKELYSKHNIYPEDIKTWDDFKKLPTITKEDILQNESKFIVDRHKNDKNLIVSRSSGSTGQVMNIFFEGRSWIEQALITLRMYQQALDYKPFDKQALIYTSNYPYKSILGLYNAYYLHTLTPPEELINKLLKLDPEFIVSYPSILLELIHKFPDKCKKLHPKGISTNSEHSSQKQRDFMGEFFNCSVFDEYSTEELTLVGYQCRNKYYHLQEDSVYLEILNPDSDEEVSEGNVGEIVGTCLVNNIMPFIRYRQNDLGALKKSDCTCKSNGRIINNISGRKDISFKLPDGNTIPSGRLLDWTYELILKFKIPILQYQLIQTTLHTVDIIIIPDSGYKPESQDQKILNSFREEFGDSLQLTLQKVVSIPRTPVGKHLPIRSLI